MEAYRSDDGIEELVRKAVDQSRLMEGENSASREPADVEHWITVYSELIAFKSNAVKEMTEMLPNLSEDAAAEVGEIDVTLVRRQRQRYEDRLNFWKKRAHQLAKQEPPPTKTGDEMPDQEARHRPDELAEGENPSTRSHQEAEQWVQIYTELTEMEDDIIRAVKERISGMSPAARRETERTNLPTLEGDATRFHARLAFWRQRLSELKGQG